VLAERAEVMSSRLSSKKTKAGAAGWGKGKTKKKAVTFAEEGGGEV
jgi:hypothetical protein